MPVISKGIRGLFHQGRIGYFVILEWFSETAIVLADILDTVDVNIFYDRREKTEVTGILYICCYLEILESLEKLRQFIAKGRYKLSGYYEEVYLVFEYIESNPKNMKPYLGIRSLGEKKPHCKYRYMGKVLKRTVQLLYCSKYSSIFHILMLEIVRGSINPFEH